MIEFINTYKNQVTGNRIEQLIISSSKIQIISPYLSQNKLISNLKGKNIRVLTKLSWKDCIQNPSHLIAIKQLYQLGAHIKVLNNLHSKIYLFDDTKILVGSSNFTENGLFNNIESNILLDIIISQPEPILPIFSFIEDLWKQSNDLSIRDINRIDDLVAKIKNAKKGIVENEDEVKDELRKIFEIEKQPSTKDIIKENDDNNKSDNDKENELEQNETVNSKNGLIDNCPDLTEWEQDIYDIIKTLNKTFELKDVYKFTSQLQKKHPDNNNVQAKIRQQLQFLRDKGCLKFISRGKYERLK